VYPFISDLEQEIFIFLILYDTDEMPAGE